VGINRGRKAPYFTRHFKVFLHSFHGLALVPRTSYQMELRNGTCMKLTRDGIDNIKTLRNYHLKLNLVPYYLTFDRTRILVSEQKTRIANIFEKHATKSIKFAPNLSEQ
jgi:hypothetical protein